MRKFLRTCSILALTGLMFSCNSKTSSSVSESSSQTLISSEESSTTSSSSSSSESSSVILSSYKAKGVVTNVFKGPLGTATVKLNDEVVAINNDGTFTLENLDPNKEQILSIRCSGYESQSINIQDRLLGSNETIDLGEFELIREYGFLGNLAYKSWNDGQYEAFSISTSRSSKGLIVKCSSPNKSFIAENRVAQLEIYVSTGEVSSSRNENVFKTTIRNNYDIFTDNCGGEAVRKDTLLEVKEDNGLDLIVTIPYDLLGIKNDEIVGISAGEWSENDNDWAPMLALDSSNVSNVENPVDYVRCDKDNYCFICRMNCYPEDIPLPSYDKESLTQGYDFHTADPMYTNKPDGDDIYLKSSKTETSFVFDMIGFGTFENHEFVKMIIHTSTVNSSGWALQDSDITFLVNREKAVKKTGLTDFWAYRKFGADDISANHNPEFTEYEEGYFTLKFEVDFSEIPNYDPSIKVSMFMMEFYNGNTTGDIYDARDYNFGMIYQGEAMGDPASQSSYLVIQEKEITVDKETLIADKDIEFSIGGGHIYANVERKDEVMTLNLVSFNSFSDNDFMRFIVHSSANDNSGWGLDATDVSFVIYKDKAYIQTGKTGFWEDEAKQFHGEDTSLYEVNYFEEGSGQYWTLSLDIDYSEVGQSIAKDTPLKALLVQFCGGSIQNNGFKQNGEVKGDIAVQSNYFTI